MADEFESIKTLPTRIDLRKEYPIAVRTIFERSFWAILAVLVAFSGYIYSLQPESVGGIPPELRELDGLVNNTFYYILKITCIVCVVKLIYEALFFYTYSYIIELEHLTITRGLFFRTRASFPIAKINDVSLKRNLIQLLFGIYIVDILTASPEMQFGEVHGLTPKNAIDLQSFLLALVETTLPEVRNEMAEDVADGKVPEEAIPDLMHRPVTPTEAT